MEPARNGRHAEPELQVLGYCVYCRNRRQMLGAIQVCNRRGGRDLKGHCAVCGKSMYRLGGGETVVAAAKETGAGEGRQETASTRTEDDTANLSVARPESMVY